MSIVSKVALELGVTPGYLYRLAHSAPHRYKDYKIVKRDGCSFREIAQPAKEVKAVQRVIVSILAEKLPVHTAATAYKKGSKILHNAEVHANSRFLLKLDFKDFFPSILPNDFVSHLSAYWPTQIARSDIEFLNRMLFWAPANGQHLRLAIGAPSSPFIANTVLHNFDVAISASSDKLGAQYTRYADDIAVSSNGRGVTSQMYHEILRTIRVLKYPSLKINDRKTLFTSKKYKRRITGLIISNEGDVSLGRSRKRQISAMVHRFMVGRLDDTATLQLRGLMAFALDIEPSFVDRLSQKYGPDVLCRLGVNT